MKATTTLEEQRIREVLQIRLDGAEEWDVVAHVADKEKAGEEPWTVTADPLNEEQIVDLISEADKRIAASRPAEESAVARHLAMRGSLYARAIQAGEIRAALAILADIAKIEEVYPAKAKASAAPPAGDGMTWILIGIPAPRYREIAEEIELLATVEGIRIDIEPSADRPKAIEHQHPR
jgi:hypothetical protein